MANLNTGSARVRMKNIKLKSGDFPLVLITMGLVIFGIIMVFSASYYYSLSHDGTPFSYLKKNVMWAVLGTGLMMFMAVFDYRKLRKFAVPIIIISGFLLILVLVPGIGIVRNSASRWLGVGSFTIMPGEIAKLAVIIFVAAYFSTRPGRILSVKEGILPMLLLCGIFGGLIMRQPNLSTAITLVAIVLVMMLVAGMEWKYLGGATLVGIAGLLAILTVGRHTFWYDRITSFTDPFKDALGEGFQVTQSLMALGSGGLFGLGLGKSIQKNLYLPEPQNDFILAIIGEELGYIGVIILLLVYMLLIWRGLHIAINATDQFGMLLATGITAMIGIQVILNIAVVTSSMPPTGIILPFVSYGGNALMIFMGSIGILLNISRHKDVTAVSGERI